jgi:plasmid stabilization system protein ParE
MARAPLTRTANRQIREIAFYLLNRHDREVARLFAEALDQALQFVATTPELGTPRPEWEQQGVQLRSTRAGRHIVIYASEQRPPTVVAVFHERQDIEHRMDDVDVEGELDE